MLNRSTIQRIGEERQKLNGKEKDENRKRRVKKNNLSRSNERVTNFEEVVFSEHNL